MHYYKTVISEVGPEVRDLLEGGVLILYADGAPPELAEVSVLHRAEQLHPEAPRAGSQLRIGEVSAFVTAVGPTAWNKVNEMGHVVINFNGSSTAERPGEICAQPVDTDALLAWIRSGTVIEIVDV
ncbi:PTS glucitol/sorbitol transporter subunit IIA [Paraburkholderia sp.]|jgi:glucitol/sorbitol PTS system EIIA component|uniref:PTS glucitol/sorbitol transporter subunit IIA n=1 Tax=Paraburkholderia sp. TaxID=1926495 RepID=UPI001AAF53B2|nr:PTS glucitol/sorbitol transporter subunit IIA [Paraburkholderia sp.]